MCIILLVEEDINISNIIADYLVLEGFSVLLANSIKIASYYLLLFKPSLIIADIMMNQLNGYDFIKIVRLDYRFMKVPFIFLTAKGMTHDRIKGYKLGCNLYLTKPFNPQEFISIIQNTLQDSFQLNVSHSSHIYSQDVQNIYNNPLILSFTYREKAVLRLLLKGYTNKEIAIQLNLSIRNIEKYISRLLFKTYSRNRIELVKSVLSLYKEIDLLFI